MTKNAVLLGVDLGGSKIEAALLNHSGAVLYRLRRTTPVDSYVKVLQEISDLCDHIEDAASLNAKLPLGICTPGSPSPASGLMRNCNSVILNGQALRDDLENCCGRPVRMANDADCLVLSEACGSSALSTLSVFGVILGTGVGGGFSIHGKLLQGPNAVSGEWGHNRMPLERVTAIPRELRGPRPCYCGRQDCIETWLSGPGLALTHEQLHRQPIDTEQLRHQQPDTKHHATLVMYADMLAAALASIVNIVDPDVIVLGGGLSNIAFIYQALPDLLEAQVFSDICLTRLCAAQHGDSSGVRGAAWLWQTPAHA